MRSLILLPLLAVVPPITHADDCAYSAPRNTTLDATGLKSLQVDLGSTDLDIQSAPGLDHIEVHGTACASDARWLKDEQIDASRQGGSASISARNNHNSIYGFFGSSYAYLKLKVRVPPTVAVSVDSGSGDIHAAGLAALDLRSGSGDLDASRVLGALGLQLGSADAHASDVGSVQLHGTGSGDVVIDTVHGDVQADRSGSGDLDFSHVDGNINVGHTGSGDVSVRDITGSVHVGHTGSGDVRAVDVGGDFTVDSTGSGDVIQRGVKGKVNVPKDDE